MYNCTKAGNRRINHLFLTRISALLIYSAHVTILNSVFRFYNCKNCIHRHTSMCSVVGPTDLFVGCGGALLDSMSFDRRVVVSNPALAAT